MSPIKAVLFDIGGVCAGSPFQAILDHEHANSLPIGYINRCISFSKPDGAWHRLERGEMDVDDRFFDGFAKDLQVQAIWDECRHAAAATSTKGKEKAVTASTPPPINSRKLFWEMMAASRTLDPHIFPVLQRLRSSGRYVVAALSNTVIFDPNTEHASASKRLAAEFDVYISSAHVGFRKPDPKIFELAVSAIDGFARRSASRAGSTSPREWADGVRADEVVFLDDIGENCKAGRGVGLRTIKVNLGRTHEAVEELEKELGLDLSGTKDVAKL